MSPLILASSYIAYGCLGAAVSGTIFNKMSHCTEYHLNKREGDYTNPKQTLDGRIIVSIPANANNYYSQNISLMGTTAIISFSALKVLLLVGCPIPVLTSLAIGSIAAPIFFGLLNMALHYNRAYDARWVELNDEEVRRHRIDRNTVPRIEQSVRVYCGFGRAPTYFPGEYTHE